MQLFHCSSRRLANNPLACGCNVFNTIVDVVQSVRSNALCATPSRVKGATFPGNYQTFNRRDFTCGRLFLVLTKKCSDYFIIYFLSYLLLNTFNIQ